MRRFAFISLRLALLAVAASCVLPLSAEKKPFERYQSILDRQPFGAVPPGFDPMRSPDEVQKGSQKDEVELTKEQEDLQKSVQFSVINIEENGAVMVGFTDKTDAKSPCHYYIALGETSDGWFVKEADPVKESMTVVKDGVEITLELGANSTPVGGGKSAKGGGKPSSPQRTPLLNRARPDGGPSSFRGRRAAREQREAEERAERERSQAEAEAKAAEEKAAREAEKAEREAEREEQREQLMNIREELRRAREEKAARKAAEEAEEGGGDEG